MFTRICKKEFGGCGKTFEVPTFNSKRRKCDACRYETLKESNRLYKSHYSTAKRNSKRKVLLTDLIPEMIALAPHVNSCNEMARKLGVCSSNLNEAVRLRPEFEEVRKLMKSNCQTDKGELYQVFQAIPYVSEFIGQVTPLNPLTKLAAIRLHPGIAWLLS